MDFNAAIFDLDGTILDSMDVWEHIDIQFLKKRNLPVPENYVTEICARSFEEAAQYTIDLFGLQETVEGIIEEWNNMAVEEYSNHVGLLPHALDYLLRLKEHGIKLAVATGLPEKLYMALVRMIYGDSGWDKKMSYRLIGRAFPQQRLVSFKITDAMQIENGRVLTEM